MSLTNPATTTMTVKCPNYHSSSSGRGPMGKGELESWLSTLDIWLLVFGIVVAVGVAGEAIVGVMHWRSGNQLRAIQNAENLSLQHDIEEFKATSEAAKAEA